MTAPAATQDRRPARLSARALALGYRDREVVTSLDLDVPDGRITCIVGPNACGKSTLLGGLARLLAPQSGQVLLDGRELHRQPTRHVAARLGLLPQTPVAPDGLTVEALVARGRYPHQSWLRQWAPQDKAAVDMALSRTRLADLRHRPVAELSGGQRQRVWIALALAQDVPIMLLDEPTTFLDVAHRVEVLDLLVELNTTDRRTIVLVLHDLHDACRYAHHLIAMRDGKIVAQGEPRRIVTPALVRDVFGIDSVIVDDPDTGAPLILPRAARRLVVHTAASEATQNTDDVTVAPCSLISATSDSTLPAEQAADDECSRCLGGRRQA